MATDFRSNQAQSGNESGVFPTEPQPNIDHLITEDDKPVDNVFSEKQQRLLTEPLYSSWTTETPFLALANVGLFHSTRLPPLVPDFLLSLNVRAPENLFPKSNRSYFVWEYGKAPEVVIEIVSNREGNEDGEKLSGYARIGIPFYVIYDPERWLRSEKLRFYELRGGRYELLVGTTHRIPSIGLGFTLWNGSFEGHQDEWLRWTDLQGTPIATGAENAYGVNQLAAAERQRADTEQQRADTEQQRADTEQQRADTEQQRADTEQQRADTEQQRADTEQQRADTEQQRAARFWEQLKRLGIQPEA